MKLVVVSIVLNEEKKIGEVLQKIPQKIEGIDEIEKMIVDDGSTDKTVEIAKKNDALVYKNGKQKRLAYSFQKAVRIALERGADIMVNIDGDMQFNPEQIPKLIDPILNGDADFVASDRFTDPETGKVRRPENMPFHKYWSNRLGSWIVSKLTGYSFPDVTCGFRAYNREALFSMNINSKYTYTQESFQVLANKKMNIESVPVHVKYFPNRKSRVVTSFFKFLFGSAINILRAFRDQAPLTFFGLFGGLFAIPGFAAIIFMLVYWLINQQFTPYKFVGLSGIYLFSLGLIIWILGLVADMMDRVINNQEKILYEAKKQNYSKE